MMNRSENYHTIKTLPPSIVAIWNNFLFYFMDAPDDVSTCHMLEIEDEAA